jgi:uncharacterized protein (DUF3084 family)
MFWTLLALISLVILGGFLSYYGDLQGRRWGKKRVSWFGLRPKHTAILITSITGAFVSLLSIVTVLIAAPAIRDVVLRGELAIRDTKRLNANLLSERLAFENKLKETRNEGLVVEGKLKERERQLVHLSNDVNDKKKEIETVRRDVQVLTLKKNTLDLRLNELEREYKIVQARLTLAQQKNQLLARDNRKFTLQNKRAEDINKDLGNQNVQLARENFEIEGKNKALQDENNELVRNNAGLKREGEELKRGNAVLTEVNKQLIADNMKLGTENATLQAKVSELQQSELALTTRLAGAGQTFSQSFNALRQGRLMLRAGAELGRRVIPAHMRPEAVQREILALLTDASANAQRLGGLRGDNGRAVAIVKKRVVTLAGVENTEEKDSIAALVEALTGGDKDVVLLANALNNTVVGEQVMIELTPRPVQPIYKKEAVVATRIINARLPVERIADSLVEFLQKDVRIAAIDAGIIPQIDPETGTEQLGVAVPRDLVLLTDRVRRTGGRVKLEAIATDALTSADSLRITFRLSRAE